MSYIIILYLYIPCISYYYVFAALQKDSTLYIIILNHSCTHSLLPPPAHTLTVICRTWFNRAPLIYSWHVTTQQWTETKNWNARNWFDFLCVINSSLVHCMTFLLCMHMWHYGWRHVVESMLTDALGDIYNVYTVELYVPCMFIPDWNWTHDH